MTQENMPVAAMEQEAETAGKIAVSVYCLAFNHEKHIRDALEGFVNQKTTFRYEVFVHDDASTDGTATIIAEYARKYPQIIKPIYQTENQYSRGVNIVYDIIWPRMQGKYVASCEGDDYWSDPQKLQLQYEAMERHPECTICSHYTRWIRMEDETTGGFYPNRRYRIKEGIVDKNTQMLVSIDDLFHLSSAFLRRTDDQPAMDFVEKMPVGDVAMLLFYQKHGYMYFVDREMSVYRRGTAGSWTKRVIRNPEVAIKHFQQHKEALRSCKTYFEGKYSDVFDRKIRDCDFAIAAQKKDYKTLTKNLSYVYRTGGAKWVAKVLVCAVCPPVGKLLDSMKKY